MRTKEIDSGTFDDYCRAGEQHYVYMRRNRNGVADKLAKSGGRKRESSRITAGFLR